MTDGDTGFEGEVSVYFTTSLPDALKVPEDPFMILTKLSRYGLSEVVNHLLGLEVPKPFDFLVNGKFLRTSLSRYMRDNGITSETALTIQYLLALPKPESKEIDASDDWISSVSGASGVVVSSSYDGHCRMYATERLMGGSDVSAQKSTSSKGVKKATVQQTAQIGTLFQSQTPVKVSACFSTSEPGYFGLITGSADGEVCVSKISSSTGEAVDTFVLRHHMTSVEAVAASPDNATLASGSNDGTVCLWSNPLESGSEQKTQAGDSKKRKRSESSSPIAPRFVLEGHTQAVTSLSFPSAPSLRYCLLSSSLDQTVRVWDVPSAATIATWPVTKAAWSVSSSPSGRQISTSHEDGRLRIWDVLGAQEDRDAKDTADGKRVNSSTRLVLNQNYLLHKRVSPAAVWNPYNEYLIASVSHDGALKLVDVRSPGLALQTVTMKDACKLLCVAWIDATTLVTGGSDGRLHCHSVKGGQEGDADM